VKNTAGSRLSISDKSRLLLHRAMVEFLQTKANKNDRDNNKIYPHLQQENGSLTDWTSLPDPIPISLMTLWPPENEDFIQSCGPEDAQQEN
jgi:hypothetical protein